MADERVLDGDAVEETDSGLAEGSVLPEVRALPDRRSAAALDSWRGEVGAIAVVAAGGLACGVATVAALSAAAKSRSGARSRAIRRVSGNRDGIVASRSFLVDVHLLGR